MKRKKIVFTECEPDYNMVYDFEEELSYVGGFVCGNRDFIEMGDKELVQIAKGDYYDEEVGYEYRVGEMLKKKTNMNYEKHCIRGYSQGDWNYVFIPKENADKIDLSFFEAMYFGKFKEYYNEDYCSIIITDDDAFEGDSKVKQIIAEEIGEKPTNIILKRIKSYTTIPVYEEV